MPEGTNNTPAGATPATPAAPTSNAAKSAPPVTATDANFTPVDVPLGEGGKKALEAEREARRDLERQIGQLKDGLASVFGGKPDGKASTEDVISALSKQVADMQHDAAVYRLAAAHQITDQDDIELLRSAKDEDAMTRLATRLAIKAEDAARPGTPKPDLTQGAGKGGSTPPALNSDDLTESLKRAVGAQ